MECRNTCDGTNLRPTDDSMKYEITEKLFPRDRKRIDAGRGTKVENEEECNKLCKDADRRISACTHIWYESAELVVGFGSFSKNLTPFKSCYLFDGPIRSKASSLHAYVNHNRNPSDQINPTISHTAKIENLISIVKSINCKTDDERRDIQRNACAQWNPVLTCTNGPSADQEDDISCELKAKFGFTKSQSDGTSSESSDGGSSESNSELTKTLGVEFNTKIGEFYEMKVAMENSMKKGYHHFYSRNHIYRDTKRNIFVRIDILILYRKD